MKSESMELTCKHAEEVLKVKRIEIECTEFTCKHTEGVVPFSGNSFSFTSLIATITLFSAFVGEWIIGFEYYCRLCALPFASPLLLAEIELPGFVLSRPSALPSRTPLKRKSQVRKVFEGLTPT